MDRLKASLQTWYQERPLTVILLAGLFFRLLAVIFSKGFGMHDDHFLVIEAAQSFADGKDYNNWLPWNQSDPVPSAHSWFYVGIHYCFFKLLNFIGLHDPQGKMYVIRLIHALFSLLTITLGYRISRLISDERTARLTAWMLAITWLMPGMSVRNLVEMVCIPPLLASSWMLIRYETESGNKLLILSGVFLGLAMGIRFQSMFFALGTGIYLISGKKWKSLIVLSSVTLITFFITQIADLFLWHRPFAEFAAYIEYNLQNSTTYFDSPWYQYFLTVGGLLVPPISVFLLIGYFRHWKKFLILVLPSFCFFVFHSYFPNKQERFILPFIPYMIVAGLAGWSLIRMNFKSLRWEQNCWKFFWFVNALPLVVVSTMYTKRSMVECMYYLYDKPDYNTFIMETSHQDGPQWPPQFYSGKWNQAYCIYKGYPVEKFDSTAQHFTDAFYPRYVLFFQQDSLKSRVEKFQQVTGKQLELMYIAKPSYLDDFLHRINRHNKNNPVFVYRRKN